MVHQTSPSVMEIYWGVYIRKHFYIIDHNIDIEEERRYDYADDGCKIAVLGVPLVPTEGYHRVYLRYYQSNRYFYLYAYEVVNDVSDGTYVAFVRP